MYDSYSSGYFRVVRVIGFTDTRLFPFSFEFDEVLIPGGEDHGVRSSLTAQTSDKPPKIG